MGLTKFSLATCLLASTLAHVSLGQNSPQDYLRVHDAARAQVGVGPMTWDAKVAAYAQDYANKRVADCGLVHSDGPYGENLAEASYALTGAEAVQMWVDEKPYYNYDANICVGGQCLHYTQVVWRNSTRLGCARVKCNSGWWFVTCNYDPPGNYVGERPY
ncbi:basic form of pathogenesis-related protein 1-like [Herrania umbratica]|uniref:Pathogenesis-related protein 1 n=1 Tax=Herrania umbratica TaxID=108875 RepID=A0A6J1BLB2_9ROSI|nr:basic form of pathogenesis-related protein 1-like [Herrania umbratica]